MAASVDGVESGDLPAPDSAPGRTPAVRVSDADREIVVERLRAAHVEGRLTLEEMTGRVEVAYTARFAAELSPLTADLPAPAGLPASLVKAQAPAGTDTDTDTVAAIFSGADRRGRWRVAARTRVLAVFGGVALDLREAQLAAPEVTMTVTAVFGGVEIVVPEGVEVQLSGLSLFGGKTANVPPSPPGAPVVNVRVTVIFGGVQVRAKRKLAIER